MRNIKTTFALLVVVLLPAKVFATADVGSINFPTSTTSTEAQQHFVRGGHHSAQLRLEAGHPGIPAGAGSGSGFCDGLLG